MKILTNPQANEVIALLLNIEKTQIKEKIIVDAEKIRTIILQAEQATLKLEQ